MKKIFYILILSTVILSSCDVHSSDNGDLDNMWYLVQVDTLSNGRSVDYRSQKVFWSFQGSLMQTNCANDDEKYMYKFEKSNQIIKVSSPFHYDRINGDEMITEETLDVIRPFGINSLNETFSIESLNNKKMVLKNDNLCLTFEQY